VFRDSLPEGAIFAPADLLAACPGAASLQEAVTDEGCGWPRLVDLKGRVILVVSDGREAFREGRGYDVSKDLLFLVAKGGKKGSLNKDPDVVFFNMSGANPFAGEVKDAGFVSRCYFLDKKGRYLAAKDAGCHHLATDLIDPDKYPWSNTAQEDGFPFEP